MADNTIGASPDARLLGGRVHAVLDAASSTSSLRKHYTNRGAHGYANSKPHLQVAGCHADGCADPSPDSNAKTSVTCCVAGARRLFACHMDLPQASEGAWLVIARKLYAVALDLFAGA